MAAPKSESKQGLVVTLVFFILATIALAVWGYMEMGEVDKLKQEPEKAKKAVAVADEERTYYMTVVGILRAYLGAPAAADSRTGRELPANKSKFDSNGYAAYKDFPELKALADKLAAFARWDQNTNLPVNDVFKLLKQKDEAIKLLNDKVVKLEEERTRAQSLRTAEKTKRDADKLAFDNATKKLDALFKEEQATSLANYRKLEDKFKVKEDKPSEIAKQLTEEKLALQAKLTGLQTKLTKAETLIVELQAKSADHKADDRPLALVPRGRIVRVHGNLRKVTINIGRGQNLKPGTTFSVYGLAPNGKPKVRSKGKVEVVSVGDTTSEVAITHLFHPDDPGDAVTGKRKEIDVLSRDNTDPIVRDDVLINPLWNPNAETHVVIAGVVDFQGTGAINVQSFVRLLEKQNVRVDAYVDPADGTIKGPGMTRRTDFLILGGVPTGVGKNDDVRKKINEATDKLLKEARANAVTLVNPRRFLQDTGLNIPRTVSQD